ncbi:hypothetical protein QBC35DRAFT_491758 [Podospora australis]|uniref:Uncharacterized protein n=1 Tax=Podospora australis TaxID=1536484 RepID=A0AAN6WX44_9PEZI|nr:hypothetical protein QBC35DRAFT_491758 [Podospora australis]
MLWLFIQGRWSVRFDNSNSYLFQNIHHLSNPQLLHNATNKRHKTQKKMSASSTDLVYAYRKLLRAGLRAVQFAKPSRYIITEQLRKGFRDRHGVFDAERIRRTVWFLNSAAQSRGIEHKILKNLCRVHWERDRENQKLSWKLITKLAQDKASSTKKKLQ